MITSRMAVEILVPLPSARKVLPTHLTRFKAPEAVPGGAASGGFSTARETLPWGGCPRPGTWGQIWRPLLGLQITGVDGGEGGIDNNDD